MNKAAGSILLCGSSGFVGRHLLSALQTSGHEVRCAVRRPSLSSHVQANFLENTSIDSWLPQLQGVSVVINTVGILRNDRANSMDVLHGVAPKALFEASVLAGVEKIVHLSALGMDRGINTAYFTSRMLAEQTLSALASQVRYLCLRPSLIYGKDGNSSLLFKLIAKSPMQLLPDGGRYMVQPVHIDDLTAAVLNWLHNPKSLSQTIDVVGRDAVSLRGLIDSYRMQAGYKPAYHASLDGYCLELIARVGDLIPTSPFSTDTLTMLRAGSTGDSSAFEQLLNRPPLSYREFMKSEFEYDQ